jgi:hypothetical protein
MEDGHLAALHRSQSAAFVLAVLERTFFDFSELEPHVPSDAGGVLLCAL